jgi:hypothetical protein
METFQVTDYLLKRGFTKTEAIFRQESSRIGNDGRPFHQRVDEMGPKQYLKAFNLLKTWIENNLDLYKVEAQYNRSTQQRLLTCIVVRAEEASVASLRLFISPARFAEL